MEEKKSQKIMIKKRKMNYSEKKQVVQKKQQIKN